MSEAQVFTEQEYSIIPSILSLFVTGATITLVGVVDPFPEGPRPQVMESVSNSGLRHADEIIVIEPGDYSG